MATSTADPTANPTASATASPPVKPREMVHALVGLRAVVSAWVLGFHMLVPLRILFPGLAEGPGLLSVGFLGVDVFFVLSGYVMTLAHEGELGGFGPRAAVRFWWMRLVRIYPLHLAMLLLLIGGVVAARLGGFERFAGIPLFRFDEVPAQLLLVQGWGASPATWNVPAWSLSCEWLAYLAFPAVALGLAKLRDPIVALVLAVSSLGLFVAFSHGVHGGELDLTYSGGAARVAGEFLAGCLLQRAVSLSGFRAGDRSLMVLIFGGVLGVAVMGVGPWLVFPAAALVVLLARSDGTIARAFGGPRLRWLGERSFALYMVQGPLLLVARGVFPEAALVSASPAARLLWLVAVAGGVFVAAAACFSLIERPARLALLAWFPSPRRT